MAKVVDLNTAYEAVFRSYLQPIEDEIRAMRSEMANLLKQKDENEQLGQELAKDKEQFEVRKK